jgi:hypothetical protein
MSATASMQVDELMTMFLSSAKGKRAMSKLKPKSSPHAIDRISERLS